MVRISSTTTNAIALVVRLDRSRDDRRLGPMGDEPEPDPPSVVAVVAVVTAGEVAGTGLAGRAARALPPRPGPDPGRAGGRGPLGTEPREGADTGVAGRVVEVLLDPQQLVV